MYLILIIEKEGYIYDYNICIENCVFNLFLYDKKWWKNIFMFFIKIFIEKYIM